MGTVAQWRRDPCILLFLLIPEEPVHLAGEMVVEAIKELAFRK